METRSITGVLFRATALLVAVGCEVGQERGTDRVIATDYGETSAVSTLGPTQIHTRLRSADHIVGDMSWDLELRSVSLSLFGTDEISQQRFTVPDEVPSGQRANELLHDRWLEFDRGGATSAPGSLVGVAYDDCSEDGYWSSNPEYALDSCAYLCCTGGDEGAGAESHCKQHGEGSYWCSCHCYVMGGLL